MTCTQIHELLPAYTDGELSPAHRVALERHMALCPACVTNVRTYRRTVDLVRHAYDYCAIAPARTLVQSILAATSGR